MRYAIWQKCFSVCLIGFTLLAVAACGTASTQGNTPTTPPRTTPTSVVTPTAAATPIPTCVNLLPGATPVGALAGFTDITFPAGTVKANMQATTAGPAVFQIVQYDICFTGQVSDVNGPFSAHQSIFARLLASGWGQGNPSGFPYDGQLIGDCHPQPDFCLITTLTDAQTTPTERLATIEKITDHGNGTITFHLQLAYPPPIPNCPAGATVRVYRQLYQSSGNLPAPAAAKCTWHSIRFERVPLDAYVQCGQRRLYQCLFRHRATAARLASGDNSGAK